MIVFVDNKRHMICHPYSIENLHKMAEKFGIKRGWFHSKGKYSHYDIPKKRIDEIMDHEDVLLVSSKFLLKSLKN